MTDKTTSESYPELTEEQERILLQAQKPDDADFLQYSSAEDIANTLASIRSTQFIPHADKKLTALTHGIVMHAETTIDATVIYEGLVDETHLGKPVYFYEDHTSLAPPFTNFNIAYQNRHGNIIVMSCLVRPTDGTPQWEVQRRGADEDEPEVDWSVVNRTIEIVVWLGGQANNGERLPPTGPVHMWRIAVDDKGVPQDISWISLRPDYPMQLWDMALLTTLGAMNYLGCRNVEAVEPTRPRSIRRRMERKGVVVKILNVFPAGKSSSSSSASGEGGGSPLMSVRGHFATYGQDGKGLLFGKYAGRFWRPAYARGSADNGVIEKDYRLND